MKRHFRFLAALLALMALVLFQVEGLWASQCSAEMEMPAASQGADADSHAPDHPMGQPGDSHEPDSKGPQGPACPLIPAGASSCVGGVALPPFSVEPALGAAGAELAQASYNQAKDLLLADSLLRPPRA